MPSVEIINKILPLLVLLAQGITLVLLLSLLVRKEAQPVLNFFSRKAFIVSFLVALTSMLGSLYYSDIAGYEPCKLCWYQRILMYPLVFLLGFALLRRRKDVTDYALLLSSMGSALSLYHYLLQIGVAPSIGCEAIGYSVSCSQRFVYSYGYMTIPMMAFAGFTLITVLLLVTKLVVKGKAKS